jgi:hypothetical protein
MWSGEGNAPKQRAIGLADMSARRLGGDIAHLAAVSDVDDVNDMLNMQCRRRGFKAPIPTWLTRQILLHIMLDKRQRPLTVPLRRRDRVVGPATSELSKLVVDAFIGMVVETVALLATCS